MMECYQVVFGHQLGPRIIHICEEFVKICNLGFWFKIWIFWDSWIL